MINSEKIVIGIIIVIVILIVIGGYLTFESCREDGYSIFQCVKMISEIAQDLEEVL